MGLMAKLPVDQIEEYCLKQIKERKLSQEYSDRFSEELKFIKALDRAEYILLMCENIKSGKVPKRKNQNGLVFSFLLGITDIDPVQAGIPHNKYLSDPPDIDVDMSIEAKDRVEEYLIRKHGQDKVAHIYTTNLFSPKSLIRTLCRVMNLTDDMKIVGEISDYFSKEVGEENDLPKQVDNFKNAKEGLSANTKKFLESKPKYTAWLPRQDKKLTSEDLIFKYMQKMSGQVQTTGKHASGIAISSEPFVDFAPLKKVKGEILLALQEGGHAKEVSAFGCLKYDWLGLVNV